MGNMETIFIFLGFMAGAVIGSFINAAAMRTVAEKKWWGRERSVCDKCGRELNSFDLVPVISYLVLQGRCRTCLSVIPPRHFIAELTGGILGAFSVWYWGLSAPLFFSFIALFFMLFHSLTDIESGYIYDSWAIASAVVSLLARIPGGLPALIDGALGAILGFALIYAIVLISGGGMGTGDAMMMIGIGALMGWKLTILSLYLGFMTSGLIVIPLLLAKKINRKDAIPLGPYLAAGCILAIFTGRYIFDYLGLSLGWPWSNI
ncbi:MAG: A24 family peptidase [Synergistaceae bacterium]|nr:A24 family peptidase [Synergistaceae bacterium]